MIAALGIGCCSAVIAWYFFIGMITVWLWQVNPLWSVIWLAFWILIGAISAGGKK